MKMYNVQQVLFAVVICFVMVRAQDTTTLTTTLTTTQTTTPNTLPENPNCVDSRPECETWARIGFCEDKKSKNFLKKHCSASCPDLCDSPLPQSNGVQGSNDEGSVESSGNCSPLVADVEVSGAKVLPIPSGVSSCGLSLGQCCGLCDGNAECVGFVVTPPANWRVCKNKPKCWLIKSFKKFKPSSGAVFGQKTGANIGVSLPQNAQLLDPLATPAPSMQQSATPYCTDKREECSKWASLGYCANAGGFIRAQCQSSCPQYCDNIPSPTTSPVSSAPTMSPTFMPTVSAPTSSPAASNEVSCHYVAPGRGYHLPPYCAANTEKHRVRCCSSSATNPYPAGRWEYSSTCNIFATSTKSSPSENGCERKSTFDEAKAYCANVAAELNDPSVRMCTTTEIVQECTDKTGCGFKKYELFWSSDSTYTP